MGNMFSNDPALISISDISGWDTSKVQFMDNMFNGDKNLTTVKSLSHLNAHNVKQDDMFKDSALVPKCFDFNDTGLRHYLNNHKKDLYDVTNKKVIEAAITCKNRQLCLNEKITLKELYDNKLLDTISDPITKQIYKDTSYVIYENNKYVFIVED